MTPSRSELYPYLGQRIHASAVLSRRRHWARWQARLLKDVQIGEEIALSHVWIVPSPYLLKQVSVGERFEFEAVVKTYRRGNGTEDAGLVLVTVKG